MPTLKIASYRVGAAHSGSGDATRYLFLEADPGTQGTGSGGVKIYFSRQPEEVGKRFGDVIVATLPDALFSDMYHVIQTERPVYFWWQLDDDGGLESCGVATIEEPPGEGLRDFSD